MKSKDLKIQEVQKSDIYLEIRESRNPEIEESRNSESKSLHIEKIHTLSILQFLLFENPKPPIILKTKILRRITKTLRKIQDEKLKLLKLLNKTR